MRSFNLACAAFLVFSVTPSSTTSAEVLAASIIDTTSSWTDIGYTHSGGTDVFVFATGAHADNPATENWIYSPSGSIKVLAGGVPLPGVPDNCLLGKIGTSGGPFFIGNGGATTIGESGVLYLGVNDGDLTNNEGHVVVHVLDLPQASILMNTADGWTDSGYDLIAGSDVLFLPFGAHADNPATDNWVYSPGGSNRLNPGSVPLPEAPDNTLIGRIGAAGSPFHIGAGGIVNPASSGRLWLAVNDGDFTNNVGHLIVHVFDISSPAPLAPFGRIASEREPKPFRVSSLEESLSATHGEACSFGELTEKRGSDRAVSTTALLDSTQQWLDTGFDCTVDELITILAWGAHADNPANGNWIYSPGGGNRIAAGAVPMPGLPENALIGKIGPAGELFHVGSGGNHRPATSGRLYLGLNDGDLSNNVGTLIVRIFGSAFHTYLLDSTDIWGDSGFTVEAGTEYLIQPFGAHADNPSNGNWIYSPSGSILLAVGSVPLQGAPDNGLLGRVGPSGATHYLGAGGRVTFQESGTLFLTLNDGDFSNNVGVFPVQIIDQEGSSSLIFADGFESGNTSAW